MDQQSTAIQYPNVHDEPILLQGMADNFVPPAPIVKWIGGKRQLLSVLTARIPKQCNAYCEPFAGSFALGFHLAKPKIILNDANRELINLYAIVRDNVDALIASLKQHQNDEAYFYALRNCDRNPHYFMNLSAVERASRLVYLNKTCWSGMYRVNQQGEFNVPFGRYDNPTIVDEKGLRAVSDYFNHTAVQFYGIDAMEILDVADIAPRTFFYLDPPYTPISRTSSFTGYTPSGFSFTDQERLYRFCLRLHAEGHLFLMSNSAHPLMMTLYRDFNIETIRARRSINCHGDKRGNVKELLISNYDANGALLSLAPKIGEGDDA